MSCYSYFFFLTWSREINPGISLEGNRKVRNEEKKEQRKKYKYMRIKFLMTCMHSHFSQKKHKLKGTEERVKLQMHVA